MRHRVATNRLNRDSQHRRSLFANLATSLIEHGAINTSLAKAKAVQPLVEKLITKAKLGGVHHRRLVGKTLNKRKTVNRLVDVIAQTNPDRQSGHTRITKLSRRLGDNTLIVRLELVDAPKAMTVADPKKAKKAKTKEPVKSTDKPKAEKAKALKNPVIDAKVHKDQAIKSQVNVAKQKLTRTTSK